MTASLSPAGPLDVTEVLREERTRLVDLLRSLEEPDWRRPTECPAYDVQGIAAHLLGDDLSLLARQRDTAAPGVFLFLEPGQDFRSALDRFNDRWVETVRFLSPALLVDLLEVTGPWTADWYEAVDPHSTGEPVGFFGATGPSPYWQIAAREYVERWVHHHQLRRALGRPDLDDEVFLHPATAAVVRSVAAHLRDLGAPSGQSLVLSIEDLGSWTLVRHDDGWQLFDGRTDGPTAELGLGRSTATPVLSRGLPKADVEAALSLRGDHDLAARATRGIAAMTGR